MTRLKGLMVITGTALGLVLTAVGPATAAPYFQAPYPQSQYPPAAYPEEGHMRLQDLVARTQEDLRNALQYATNDKQRDRTRNAERHLSDFDKRLTQGHWDRGNLNDAINSVQGVLDHNTLNAADRERILHDVEDLRIVRDRR